MVSVQQAVGQQAMGVVVTPGSQQPPGEQIHTAPLAQPAAGSATADVPSATIPLGVAVVLGVGPVPCAGVAGVS